MLFSVFRIAYFVLPLQIHNTQYATRFLNHAQTVLKWQVRLYKSGNAFFIHFTRCQLTRHLCMLEGMMSDSPVIRQQALTEFERARRQARWDSLTSWFSGRDGQLIPFEEVRARLRQQSPLYRGLQQIPVPMIVGSVGRYQEFTRSFLPLNDGLRDRWVEVNTIVMTRGWPPIEVYQVGDGYFVRDGNHRVSVARRLGIDTIEAHVWQYPADLEIGPQDSLEALFIRLGEQNFHAKTGLDTLCPENCIRFTIPGQYSELLAQIEDLRGKLAEIDGEEMPYQEAVWCWYEMIYLPAVQIIQETNLLPEFPGRTEADLFVWLSAHREQLSDLYGDHSLADLARILAERYREGGLQKAARRVRRLLGRESLPTLNLPEVERADRKPPGG
jgi:hypothetical protein